MHSKNSLLPNFQRHILILVAFTMLANCKTLAQASPGWPAITKETKPWTRWWWQGNALTKEGITAEMEAYQKAGLGGLEITPIYGVLGYEDKFVDFLSPQWMELLMHTLKEGERLGLGIDMATGTGWPFGGPMVTDDDACKNMNYKIYTLREGQSLSEKIEFVQQPLFKIIGNTIQKPLADGVADATKFDINQLLQPIAANKNLQALALDQVKFKRTLPLQVLMAYSNEGKVVNLTAYVNANGHLTWTAPQGSWTLYALFQGWHGKMVERAGPGGEGNVIDHFSATALQHYLDTFDKAFAGKDIKSLRAFFNDSYEVDDAKGTADWTPLLFEEFKMRRGYDLKDHLPALFDQAENEKTKRILCDYRETISEMLLDNFTQPWKNWAHRQNAVVRNQAHGSPSNILDLYAVVDIPEIEGIEPLRIKMASSAGNVTGKKLVSSESATWLNEHFESTLADIKEALDRFMINGVNHLFYHGTCYSPPNEQWPGWLFYAAVHVNPRNPQWANLDALNSYAARCQSFLQNSTPDNDVLLYFPIYDRFSAPGKEMLEHFDGLGKQFANTAFERAAEAMSKHGYAFDYISDRQIINISLNNQKLKTEGNSFYKTIVIPHCQFIPVKTFQKVMALARAGATIIALEGMPASVAGYANLQQHKMAFDTLLLAINKGTKKSSSVEEFKLGKGRVLVGDSLNTLLQYAAIRREAMPDYGLKFIRKQKADGTGFYFIVNDNNKTFTGWLPLQLAAKAVVVYDAITAQFGKANVRTNTNGLVEVYVQLKAKQSIIVETYKGEIKAKPFRYRTPTPTPTSLTGKWKVTFTAGGPTLPPAVQTDSLYSWTFFGSPAYEAFSGTASYSTTFKRPGQKAAAWLLDLGKVYESAEVSLNGKLLGKLIGPTYQLYIDAALMENVNLLEVKVSNLMANRIMYMDKNRIAWKKFYNVNFPARKAENRKNGLFDAADWKPKESGLVGPVQLTAVGYE